MNEYVNLINEMYQQEFKNTTDNQDLYLDNFMDIFEINFKNNSTF